jgi:hypothetical protein
MVAKNGHSGVASQSEDAPSQISANRYSHSLLRISSSKRREFVRSPQAAMWQNCLCRHVEKPENMDNCFHSDSISMLPFALARRRSAAREAQRHPDEPQRGLSDTEPQSNAPARDSRAEARSRLQRWTQMRELTRGQFNKSSAATCSGEEPRDDEELIEDRFSILRELT